MKDITSPTKVDYQSSSENKNKGQIIVEPCFPGYGTTWGNALRRVLLSSLTGAAITAVKIKGARHEFSTIPNIKEDVLQIILNLKLLRLKLFKDEPVKLKLSAKGAKKVTAADFEKIADVEIVNSDLHIATLTDKKSSLEIEATAEKGYGYVPSEEKDRGSLDLGTIVIDSVFGPVVKVSFQVESVRVGKRTDYDKLIVDIETDGTITPWEAFIEANKLLGNQFKFLAGEIEKQRKEVDKKPAAKKTTKKKRRTKKIAKKKTVKKRAKKK